MRIDSCRRTRLATSSHMLPGLPRSFRIQHSVAEEAHKRGIAAEDALNLFPPTRTYSNAEVQKGLARSRY